MIVAIIISGVLILLTSVGLMIYLGAIKNSPLTVLTLISSIIGGVLIVFGASKFQNSPKRIEKKHQTLLENIEKSKKELEHFYIDHPEFRLQNEED